MPVSYAGTVGEHRATREAVGLFDVSHLGKALVSGPGAADFVNSALTNDLRRIGPGKAQYTLCCTADGGVIDDLIAYYVSDDEIFLVPNAANTAAVVAALRKAAPRGYRCPTSTAATRSWRCRGRVRLRWWRPLGLPTEMDYMGTPTPSTLAPRCGCAGRATPVSRATNLLPDWDAAPAVFDALVAEVESRGGQLAGLGARDTLRTEMGYPLHGHELSTEISRCRPAAGGRSAGPRTSSGGAMRCLPRRRPGPAGYCAVCEPSAAGCRGPG